MASKTENIKALFSNTRTRVIILLTISLISIAILFGVVKLALTTKLSIPDAAQLTNAPGSIRSIPGSLNQTAEYAALQDKQNQDLAKKAVTAGGSAIPTIIHSQAFGNGVEEIGPKQGLGSVGFSGLITENSAGPQQSLWIQSLKENHCSKATMDKLSSQGAGISEFKEACSCVQLKEGGYNFQNLEPICSCKELKAAGFSLQDMKTGGYTAEKLRACGFSACQVRGVGFTAQEMKDGGFSDGELKGSGFSDADVARAGGLPEGMKAADVRAAGCGSEALHRLKMSGVSAAAIRKISGCSAAQLKAAGFDANDLKSAGFSAAELMKAGFGAADLKGAGFSAKDLEAAGVSDADLLKAGFSAADLKAATASLPSGRITDGLKRGDCSLASLKAARAKGVSAETIKATLGCAAADMAKAGYTAAELKKAGFTAAELKDAGFSAADLAAAGFDAKELAAAGFSADELKRAGFNAKQLMNAGFSAKDLKKAGFSTEQLKDAGFDAEALSKAGISLDELKKAGFTAKALKDAGLEINEPTPVGPQASTPPIPSLGANTAESALAASEAARTKQLQDILKRQQMVMADQRHQQVIQQRTGAMLSAANQDIQQWSAAPTQTYVAGSELKEGLKEGQSRAASQDEVNRASAAMGGSANSLGFIKAGDILFAVIDTSVNSDEPGPILATIVSGKLKGSKLIGSFVLAPNANKMSITFNTLSVPGLEKTVPINAYAIEPDTARTALSSKTDHHYLLRYGSLFASTFVEGFGNAFQSSGTIISLGGTGTGGSVQNTTIQNGVGRSTLDNAVIGMATLGKAWSQVAQQQFSRPTTVEVYSGTGIGVLFTQDLRGLM